MKMQIFDLIIQIFMAVSFISGITMLVFTLGYRDRVRRIERIIRYVLGSLLVYSVLIRFIILMPGEFEFIRVSSLLFDVFYISITLLFIITMFTENGSNSK